MVSPGRLFTRLGAFAWVAALLLLTARTAVAQLPQARLQSVFPPGVRAGESVDVTIGGTDLEGAGALWFNHPGLRAFRLKENVFRVAAAAGTPVGLYDVRVVGKYGVSNPRTFTVGERE